MTGRQGWIDTARGIGILLVVLGHTLHGLVSSGLLADSGLTGFVNRWIYAFHMPLFFVLSGIFAVRLAGKDWPDFFRDRWSKVVYPYLLWSVLQTSTQIVLSRYTNAPARLSDLSGLLWQPVMQFWFLYALFLISLVTAALVKFRTPLWALILLALAIYVAPDYGLTGLFPPLTSFRYHFVYYVLGMALGANLAVVRFRTPHALLFASIAFGIVAALVSGEKPDGAPVEISRAILGIAGVIALSTVLAGIPAVGFLRYWGVCSLQIFVAHTLSSAGVRILLQRIIGIEDPVIHVFVGTAAGIALPLLFMRVCDAVGFRYAFTWPVREPASRPAT